MTATARCCRPPIRARHYSNCWISVTRYIVKLPTSLSRPGIKAWLRLAAPSSSVYRIISKTRRCNMRKMPPDNDNLMQIVQLAFADRSYPIYIGKGLLAQTELFVRHLARAHAA